MKQCPYTLEQLKAMQAVDVRTVDRSTLRDIRDVKVNTDLPKQERILEELTRALTRPSKIPA